MFGFSPIGTEAIAVPIVPESLPVSLLPGDIYWIINTLLTDPRFLTVSKFLALKDT